MNCRKLLEKHAFVCHCSVSRAEDEVASTFFSDEYLHLAQCIHTIQTGLDPLNVDLAFYNEKCHLHMQNGVVY